MSNTRLSNNYDLNIWDRLSYETSGTEGGGWEINVYEYDYLGAPYGSGRMLEEHTITLTPTEAKRLTLGWGTDLGGDYTPDEDFWIDKDTFFDTYTDIPERVANLLWALPEYNQSLDIESTIAV
jgi:hypothetical protein